jgi:hypothetical protein
MILVLYVRFAHATHGFPYYGKYQMVIIRFFCDGNNNHIMKSLYGKLLCKKLLHSKPSYKKIKHKILIREHSELSEAKRHRRYDRRSSSVARFYFVKNKMSNSFSQLHIHSIPKWAAHAEVAGMRHYFVLEF